MATAYIQKFGHAVVRNGYDLCLIRPGEKRPYGENWETIVYGPKRIDAAIKGGRGAYGVGIKTAKTPGVDIDCYDPALVRHMVKFVGKLLGPSLERIGLAPKTLLVYLAEEPFPKTQSKVFIDDEDRAVKLEVLGDGQQFVALHIHPDTREPYRWKDKRHPGIVPAASLPTINREQALVIVAEFEKKARALGWPEKSTVKRMTGGKVDLDDPFITDKHKVDISDNDLRAKLQMVPNAEDYDTWFHVGMALYHQYGGSEDGLLLWHEWSSQAHNYDQDALDDKWSTFDIEGKKREPLTARFILKQAKAEEERLAGEELKDVREEIVEAQTLPAIQVTTTRIKKLAFDLLTRESLILPIKDRIKAISGTTMSPTAIRKMIAFENPENRNTPHWLETFVYCQEDETFYSTKTRQKLSAKAFDASFGRFMLTKKDRLEGRSSPEHTASHVALNRYEIPVVANRMYMPGEDDIFTFDGREYVNSYSDNTVPDVPETLSKVEKQAIEILRNHFHHLFPNSKRERKLLLDYLAFTVQTNKRCNWCPVIQGAEGDGKTAFGTMMTGVLGRDNVKTILGENLVETYTSWAEGVQFCVVEEVRLHGKNRFDVINKMKPYITNPTVPVRRMRVDTYNVVNTISYLMTTNHKDGVPVQAGDTRYYPMFSQWQSQEDLERFKLDNPKYYARLDDAVNNYPGAVRKWLLEVKLSPDFSPYKRAPKADAKAEMVFLNATDEEDAFSDALSAAVDPFFSPMLLDSARVADVMLDHGSIAPQGKALKMLLSEFGFTYIGRLTVEGATRRLWSKRPREFMKDGKICSRMVRAYLTAYVPVAPPADEQPDDAI